jgi:hypothetical protein
MTDEIGHIVSLHTTPEAFVFLWPPYELDHIAVGVLLAAVILAVLGLGMLIPLLWIRTDVFVAQAP